MSKNKFAKIRLFTQSKLSNDECIELTTENVHYLLNVMRKKSGDNILLFNGIDGEWLGSIESLSKKYGTVRILEKTREYKKEPDIWLCFAPVKNAPIQNIVQKATELGISTLQPVFTQYTVINNVNTERMLANAVEASEQSERLSVPKIREPIKLNNMLENWEKDRKLILCDESGSGQPAVKALENLDNKGKYAILIGPEGGFSPTEFEIMHKKHYIIPVGLGPRILRADTAAIAAIVCYQSILGDWDETPKFRTEN